MKASVYERVKYQFQHVSHHAPAGCFYGRLDTLEMFYIWHDDCLRLNFVWCMATVRRRLVDTLTTETVS